nr:[FeFe] hydrogenase H-cluster radical SAM maturase HydG [uncultured Bacteroides sp.]
MRLWISSLTDRAIREGLQHLRPGNEYDNLYLSAKARSEADWIVGINASQALAVAAGRGVWSLGRVQTPTLAIICSRYLENKAFKPATYFRLKLSTAKEGTEFTVLSTEKFDGREKAEAARAEVIGVRTVRVVNVERKEAREQPPLLYDLTTLQKEANSRYGFSAEKTLDIAQSLYEKKFITYPRTGSRYISEDVAEEIPALIGNMTRYPRFAEYAGLMDTASLSRRSVDNEKIADHHALLPTENLPSELDADHRIVYEMVAGRMLETFSGACVKENTFLTLQSAGHDFTARGSIMVETGWRAVLNEPVEEKEEDMTLLPDIVQGDELPVKGCGTEQKQTRPRPLHTESSLLAAMETAGRELSDEAEREAMKDAGIGTYILFQETYHKKNYEALHPTGPKSNYAYHTEAMDRAMEGGIDDVGMGVLFGLNTYRYDFVGLLMHAEHLEARFGVGPHTISVPRICSADDIDAGDFPNAISDDIFSKIVAVIRIAVPYTGMIISTRESQESREKVLELGISQISGGSRTSVGGYAETELPEDNSAQFDVSDTRTLDEVVNWLLESGYIPSFCTACYREGRTGDRFMSLVKSGQIANCCGPNALMTLKEYLEDYASEDTRIKGMKLIAKETDRIPNPKIREIAIRNLKDISEGKRDFRF